MTSLDPRVGEIENRLSAATPGPWERDEEGYMGCGQVFTANEDLYGANIAAPSGDLYPRSGYSPKDDMVFIANAPADVAYLLAELRKAHEALGVAFDYGWREGKGIPTPCDTLTGELFHEEAATAKFNPYRAAVAAANGDGQ